MSRPRMYCMLLTPRATAVSPKAPETVVYQQPNLNVDDKFYNQYEQFQSVYDADHNVIVPGGNRATAIASLVASDNRVLCISDGPYGNGFRVSSITTTASRRPSRQYTTSMQSKPHLPKPSRRAVCRRHAGPLRAKKPDTYGVLLPGRSCFLG